MGGRLGALGVAMLWFTACGGPIDARLPGGDPDMARSALVLPAAQAPSAPPSVQVDGPGFGGSGNAGLGEEDDATDVASAQSLLWTRHLVGGMGFRPVGR